MVPGLTVAIAASACAVDLFGLRIDTLAERMERSGQGSKVGRSSTTGGCCLEPPAWDLRASRTLRYGTHCSSPTSMGCRTINTFNLGCGNLDVPADRWSSLQRFCHCILPRRAS
ncbi:hypothetical protein FVEN_g13165 [Fusarium venenatum]|nr:hypothetical protein FVEN_g13165 [Fusarium venenatum]